MKYTNEEIKRALSLAVTYLDAAYQNEKDMIDQDKTELDALSKALDVLVTLGIVGVNKIAPAFGDENDPII